MDPKCAKYPKVVLGRPVEGRSCKLHGKAPLTGPYTPKWRPNDEEENATYIAGGGFDKVDGNITILDCGEQIQDEVAMIEEAWVQMSSPSPNLILRLQSFYGVSPCSSWVLFIPTVTAFQCKLCSSLLCPHYMSWLHLLILELASGRNPASWLWGPFECNSRIRAVKLEMNLKSYILDIVLQSAILCMKDIYKFY